MANSDPKNTGQFGKGNKGKPKGAVNKTTAALKDAILAAAKAEGNDGKGKGGLEGYLRRVAKYDVKAFAGLLGKVLPMTVQGAGANGEHLFSEIVRRIVKPQ